MDWADILAGLSGGAGPSPLGLPDLTDIAPPIDTGGNTGLGTLGRGAASPLPPPPSAPLATPLTADEGLGAPPVVAAPAPAPTLASSASGTGMGTRAGREGVEPDVGAALTGKIPLPLARPSAGGPTDVSASGRPAGGITLGGPEGPTPFADKAAAAAKAGPDKAAKFADALKGIKAPANPELQKLTSHAPPRPTTQIKGGEYLALLQALNAGAGGGGKRPLTSLGGVLGR